MAVLQICFVGQGANISDAVFLTASTGGYAVRAVFDDTGATSNAEALRALLAIEKAVEQDTFPSAFESANAVMYACPLGANFENITAGAVAGGAPNSRFIIDRTVGDPVTSKAKVINFLHAIGDLISTYKYPYS